MNKSISIKKPNDAWIIHCNGYFIIDAYSGFCFGGEFFSEEPEETKIINLFKSALNQAGAVKPQKVLIANNEPHLGILKSALEQLNIVTYPLLKKELLPYIRDFIKGFRQSFSGNTLKGHQDRDDSGKDQKMADAMVPDTYSLCPCASGKKFKFCCQPAFKDIVFAMCSAEDGNLNESLGHLHQAEKKIGRTAEIVCRYAICWSFFNEEKYTQYLNEALTINPEHPRVNYLLGIGAKNDKQYELAIKYYNKAIDNYPKSDKFHLNETYNNLGTVYYQLKNYQKAKEAWEQGLIFLPSDDMTRNNLFECIYDNPLVPSEIRQISPFMKRYIEQ